MEIPQTVRSRKTFSHGRPQLPKSMGKLLPPRRRLFHRLFLPEPTGQIIILHIVRNKICSKFVCCFDLLHIFRIFVGRKIKNI